MLLTDQEYIRFSRHIMLDEVGEAGQIAIKQAHILIVGMGGLGCAAAQYLAAAGIGQLTLIDHDNVEVSNLQRQILFTTEDVGGAKVTIAKNKLTAINPKVKINTFYQSVFDLNLTALMPKVDVVLDCTDNIDTRYFINYTCLKAKRKLVSASAIQGQGQLISFDFAQKGSPCYQCLVPEKVSSTRNCSSLGVLSTLLGVMGSLQATEVLRLILNEYQILNQLLIFDAWQMSFKRLVLTADPECQCCKHPIKG
ncbi:HesA/MoeB/ThiF family protein [Thalassotalea piscium]|uniref:Molybdopterin/thiamine biosynthesis adenylyltransferase n=1 Tax=Thalassotalea piscium TaxID=1230533 RepID=A0A7X0NEW7_9GAMM|nr:HesA/MoeB/ThiF family protein [Thalassotalea piscium]MBB6542093.1 molybdopterin/thiamine biosynthesis adenylyltransferase [Thalassotalea piscium]